MGSGLWGESSLKEESNIQTEEWEKATNGNLLLEKQNAVLPEVYTTADHSVFSLPKPTHLTISSAYPYYN